MYGRIRFGRLISMHPLCRTTDLTALRSGAETVLVKFDLVSCGNQMAIPIKFSKSEDSVPWGFRLVGGQEFDQPIVVVKVNANGLAESAGLEVGDIVARVNDIPTAGLTHGQVHDLLLSAGCEFELGVRRGEIATEIFTDDNYDIEESNVIKKIIEEDVFNEAVRIVDSMKPLLQSTTQKTISEQDERQENTNITALKSTCDVGKGQKWSTFLVKPEKPVPKPKKKIEEEKPGDDLYQVVIRKQSRRPCYEQTDTSKDSVIEVEIDSESVLAIDTTEAGAEEEREEAPSTFENQQFGDIQTKVNNNYDADIEKKEQEENNDSVMQNTMDSMEMDCLGDLKSEEVEITPSLEVQLLAVQKQLQALSQLPSAIQMTLDAVSKQLASIVGSTENAEVNGDQGDLTSSSKGEEPETEEEFLEDTSTSERAEAELLREESEANSSIAEELEEDIVSEIGPEKYTEQDTDEHATSLNAGLTEIEMEAQSRKEELELKREKIMDQHSPARPIQRPIILPGGRKWSIPEDAIPSFRKPKMSDEKIIETIESNLELIIGNRKGESNSWKVPSKAMSTKNINFLKYQPPAKNLDYLQKSEVYRLVHDMEPPVKGITSRQEKVLAVQDYYEATKEVSPL